MVIRRLKPLVVDAFLWNPDEECEYVFVLSYEKCFCRTPWGAIRIYKGEYIVKIGEGIVLPMSEEMLERLTESL